MNRHDVDTIEEKHFSGTENMESSSEHPVVITLSDEHIPVEDVKHTNEPDDLSDNEEMDHPSQSDISGLYSVALRAGEPSLTSSSTGGTSSEILISSEEKSIRESLLGKGYKRKELSIPEKIEVIRASETGLSQRQVAKKFGISKTQVHCLVKRKNEIFTYFEMKPEAWRKRKSKRFSNDDINDRVLEWFLAKKAENVNVSGAMLQEKALQISKELQKPEFKASNGWLDNFKRRHDIGFNTITTHKPENGTEAEQNSGSRKAGEAETDLPRSEPSTTEVPSPKHHNRPPLLRPLLPRSTPAEPGSPCYPMSPQLRSLGDALRMASQLKSFSVGTGNVVLIGLTCALENELRRDLDNLNFMSQNQKPRYDYEEFPSMVRP